MKIAFALLAPVAAAGLVAGRAAAAITPGATRWIDAGGGYSIVLPDDWYVIPRTRAAIKREIASLEAAKKTSLERAFESILASPHSLAELPEYRFQAFLWPPLDSLVPTEVSLQIVTRGRYTTAELPAIAKTYARSLAGPGAVISAPTVLELPAGRSEFIQGSVANGGGVRTGLELYILVHDGRVYTLSFQIGSSFLHATKVATALRSIADAFTFSTIG